MFKTALRNVAAHRRRLLATAVAVVLGVAFMTGTLVLSDTTGKAFDNLFTDVNKGTDAHVRSADSVKGNHMVPEQRARIDESVVDAVARMDGVAVAQGTVQGYAQLVAADGTLVGNTSNGPPVLGMAWSAEPRLNAFRIADGRPPTADNEVVIDRASANEGALHVGDHTHVLTNNGHLEVDVVGIATFGGADSPGGASVVLFTETTARNNVAAPGKVDGVSVVADPGVSQREVADRIDAALPDGYEVLTGDELTAENQSEFQKGLRFFTVFLLTFAGVSLFVGSFIIFNTFSVLVAQRSRETALLRALGASRRQVLGSVLAEAAGVGLVSSVIGLGAGLGLAVGLKSLMAAMGIDMPDADMVVKSSTVVAALVIGVLVCVASAVAPAYKAGRIPPIAALRQSAVEAWSTSRGRTIAGAVVLALGAVNVVASAFADDPAGLAWGAFMAAAGAFLVGGRLVRRLSGLIGAPVARFRGVTGGIARENAMRNPKRTGTTAAALTIGVALVSFIAVLASSTKASIADAVGGAFTGDLVVDSGAIGSGGFAPELAAKLAALPEVDTAAGMRGATVEVEGKGGGVVAGRPSAVRIFADLGEVRGGLDAMGPGAIALSADAAEAHGVDVGGAVEVRFADTGVQRLRVDAVYENDDLLGDYFIDTATFEANSANRLVFKVFVTKSPDASEAEARRAVEAVASEYPQAVVQDRDDFANSQAAMVNQLVNLVYAMLALAVVIALIGIANTLSLSVLERTRELGLARAVGMTRRQVKASVRWEAAIIAVLGASVGLVLGLGAAFGVVQALASQGVTVFSASAGQLVAIAVLAAFAGVGAAVLPARRAARLDVLQAIATA